MFGTGYTGGNPMKAQTPARGISIDNEYDEAKVFNVECECTADDHAVKMWIEVQREKDIPDVEVSFYVTTWTREFWKDWPARLRAVWDILIHGVHKQEHHMLLNKQSALNFAGAIVNTVKELETKI
jgi:hypothetical protein